MQTDSLDSLSFAHAAPTDLSVPTPMRKSDDGGRTWTCHVGCTVCRCRVEVDADEFEAITMADIEGTICEECLSKIV